MPCTLGAGWNCRVCMGRACGGGAWGGGIYVAQYCARVLQTGYAPVGAGALTVSDSTMMPTDIRKCGTVVAPLSGRLVR